MIKYPFRFIYTKEIEDFFRKENIFLKHPFQIEGVYNFGETITIPKEIIIEPYACLSGKNCWMNMGAWSYTQSNLGPDALIGRYSSISWSCSITGAEHPLNRLSTHPFTFRNYIKDKLKADFNVNLQINYFDTLRGVTKIGNDVWIAQNSIIRAGVEIGNGAVVGAGSVVTKSIPPYAIVAGNPARIIRYRFSEEVIEKLMILEWWNYNLPDISQIHFSDDIEETIASLEDYKQKNPTIYNKKINIAQQISKIIESNSSTIITD